eukprot:TRINITY_DN113435_c0_g1_i1.p1 TRINITY_DN113435_c0_g1~~TRINITY_DN113435_c0_g1_i1.p1  ORF type:complete len:102 (-),score=15.70 TRINITY_DN113435_c0_g1_i1:64-369(-)
MRQRKSNRIDSNEMQTQRPLIEIASGSDVNWKLEFMDSCSYLQVGKQRQATTTPTMGAGRRQQLEQSCGVTGTTQPGAPSTKHLNNDQASDTKTKEAIPPH